MHTKIIAAISEIDARDWNRLDGTENPFLRHEFLSALETSGSVGAGTGWEPCHVILVDGDGALAGAMPLYAKTDSWGEFVFDFAWADAYHRSGLRYYPKLVSAVPFTPATGRRCLSAATQDPAAVVSELLRAARELAEARQASSVHILFPTEAECRRLAEAGLLIRKDCQFHWQNENYADFDEFLAGFTAAKRKKVRRERRRVAEAGIRFRTLGGPELDTAAWRAILPLYASSFWRRGREPYLNAEFFTEISRTMPDNIVVFVAERHGEAVGTAICFRSDETLYGRYWGSAGRYNSLHFETCYYQGIEYCIDHRLARFEPGTQGEHKLSRGFVPTATWSAHWLSHPQFAAAIDEYLDRERVHIDSYMEIAGEHTPYRRDPD